MVRLNIIQNLEKLGIPYKYFNMISLEQINELYNCIDLYIVSSRCEGGPRSVFEAGLTKTPIISTVIGEGGSGGALAIGVCDRLNMLQYSTYAVISPEGCASILWKSSEFASEAAEAMGVSAQKLKELSLIDSIIPEPLGGAHRDMEQMAESLKATLIADLDQLCSIQTVDLVQQRYKRLTAYAKN